MSPHPDQTAADLRRAAELVLEHGFARRYYVGVGHTLCADGAIRLAVGDIRLTYSEGRGALYDDTGITSMETTNRRKAALDALAPLLPIEGCSRDCDVTHAALNHPEYSDIKVYHYNDFICQGGPELAVMLLSAAERLEDPTPTQPLPTPRQPHHDRQSTHQEAS